MVSIQDVTRSLHLLAAYPTAFAWADFGDKGKNPCYDPYRFSTRSEEIEEALTLACIRIVMPKYSVLHTTLAREIAKDLGARCITYDWLIKACARLLGGFTCADEVEDAVRFAKEVQARMRELDLPSIKSLSDIGMGYFVYC